MVSSRAIASRHFQCRRQSGGGGGGSGDGGGDGSIGGMAVFAEAKANSMMRRWRRWGLFFGGVHGARGQELAHILGIMCLFVCLEYRRPREGLTA